MSVSGCLRVVAAIAVAGLFADSLPPLPIAPLPSVQSTAVRLASTDAADSPLGDGTALLMGGTSIPQPSQLYLDAADALYLQPRGFDGTLQSLFTPENASSTSEARGDQILDSTILQEFNSGDVSAQNPLVVFGYSQSASISTDVMRELAGQGVPSTDVHFVLIGDPDNPAGGSEVVTSNLYPQYLRTTSRPRTICTRQTSTPMNTTVSPISRSIRSTCSRTSTPRWASSTSTAPI